MSKSSGLRSTALIISFATPVGALLLLAMNSAGAFARGGFVETYQTLIAGVIAIAAALIGGGFIMHQVRAAERIEEDRRARTFRGARAGLAAALHEIVDYNWACTSELDRLYRLVRADLIDVASVEASFPPIPRGVVADLRELVALGSEQEAAAFEHLLSVMQISGARLRLIREAGRGGRPPLRHFELRQRLIDCAELDATASRLFDFARGRGGCPAPKASVDEVSSALARQHCDDQFTLEAKALLRSIRSRT